MNAVLEPDWSTTGILGAARGAAEEDEPIGTQHLLAGTVTSKGPARVALTQEGVTRTAVFAVLRDARERGDAWSGADRPQERVSGRDLFGEFGEKDGDFTPAAARAFRCASQRARQEGANRIGPVHLLRALLAEENHAAELLARCGTGREPVLSRLDGGPGTADALDPLLHPTRDVLLGRAQYRRMPFWQRWVTKLGGVNWAAMPGGWVRWEAYEQAYRRGDALGTEHVLLAVLATHEVAARYPHLRSESRPDPDRQYAGGALLAGRGVDYLSVCRALDRGSVPLPADPRPGERFLAVRGTRSEPAGAGDSRVPPADEGTGPLVESLLAEPTRARYLVESVTERTAGGE